MRHIDQASGNDLAARDHVPGAGGAEDRDIGRFTVGQPLLELQRRSETDGQAMTGRALEPRRKLLERRLHGGRAQHFDVNAGRHAVSPVRR